MNGTKIQFKNAIVHWFDNTSGEGIIKVDGKSIFVTNWAFANGCTQLDAGDIVSGEIIYDTTFVQISKIYLTKPVVTKDQWISAIESFTIHWQQIERNEIVLWFSGCKTQVFYDAVAKLQELGGKLTNMGDYDRSQQKTALTLKLPTF